MPTGEPDYYEAKIAELIEDGENQIRRIRDEFRAKVAAVKKDADAAAAWDLVMEDPSLRLDAEAMRVAKTGKNAEGKTVNVEAFLAGRKDVIQGSTVSFGNVKRKWNELPPDATGTSHSEEEK